MKLLIIGARVMKKFSALTPKRPDELVTVIGPLFVAVGGTVTTS